MNEFILNLSVMIVPILLAVTVHEVAHGWVADRLGDPTARLAGRLTLNPLKHLDLVGTLAFVITRMIGWAKPVPVNPLNFRRPRQDMIWVSAAGPTANLGLAVIFALLLRLLLSGTIPLPPYLYVPLVRIAAHGVGFNLGLAVFNMLPIPPLDGSGILAGLLPPRMAYTFDRIRPYGFIILLLLIFTRLVDIIIFPIIYLLAQFLLGSHLRILMGT